MPPNIFTPVGLSPPSQELKELSKISLRPGSVTTLYERGDEGALVQILPLLSSLFLGRTLLLASQNEVLRKCLPVSAQVAINVVSSSNEGFQRLETAMKKGVDLVLFSLCSLAPLSFDFWENHLSSDWRSPQGKTCVVFLTRAAISRVRSRNGRTIPTGGPALLRASDKVYKISLLPRNGLSVSLET
jgi:hypothetical protein